MSLKTWIVFVLPRKDRKEMSILELPTKARQYCNARYMKRSSVLSARTRMKITTPTRVTCLYCISVTKLTTEDISFRQSALRGFLVKEEVPASVITTRIIIVCADTCALADGVRWWVKNFEDRNTGIAGQPHSGHPRTASTERNKKKINELSERNEEWQSGKWQLRLE